LNTNLRGRAPNKSPEQVYDEAVEQIESARRRGSTYLRLGKGRRSLLRIPPVPGLPHLEALDLSRAMVSDLRPLSTLTGLRSLNLSESGVFNLSPIADLVNLETLDISFTRVSDISALSRLRKLRELNIINSTVSDLSPLAGLSLTRLAASGAPIRDIEPLMGMQSLVELLLSSTRIERLDALAGLTNLVRLNLLGTKIADISPLRMLQSLNWIDLDGTAVSDLSPLSEASALTSLDVRRTKVTDLSPLYRLSSLENLYLSQTDIHDLGPIKHLTGLEHLDFSQTPVDDLSALSGISKINVLRLSNTKVSDLSPLATLTSLATAAKRYRYGQGLFFEGCPNLDPELREISKKYNPERTVEALNYVRSREGLPLISEDVAENQDADWRTMVQRLEQNPLGVQFEIEDDYLTITFVGAPTDDEAGKDKITQQLHSQVQGKAGELASKVVRLANQPEWQSLAGAADRFNQLVSTDIATVADRIGLVWGELVSLGSSLEQDELLRSTPDAFASPLDPDLKRPLVDLLQTAGPWVRRFPTARKLDEEHAAFKSAASALKPAEQVLTAARDEDVVTNDDAEILASAIRSGHYPGLQSKKAGNWALMSMRNLVVGAVAVAAAGFTTGVFKNIGDEFASHSSLAKKATELLLRSEAALLEFVEDLPSDIRSVVRSLIQSLKVKE